MGVSNFDISSTLATSVSERLVRRLCPECRKERAFTEEEKAVINKIGEKYNVKFNLQGKKTYDAVGCKHCNNTGYYGRIGIFEVLQMDDDLKALIVNSESTVEIRKKALENGYVPLVADGIEKVLEGITNLQELNNKLAIY